MADGVGLGDAHGGRRRRAMGAGAKDTAWAALEAPAARREEDGTKLLVWSVDCGVRARGCN